MHFSRELALRLPLLSHRALTPSDILSAIAGSLRRHPKRITSTLAVLLLGTGVTAFGVAPLAPDAADLPVHQVLEVVQPLPTQIQTDALGDFRFNLFRTESTRSTDTASALLKRLNLDDSAAAAFLRTDPNAQLILAGRPGKNVTVEAIDTSTSCQGRSGSSTLVALRMVLRCRATVGALVAAEFTRVWVP